jgi:glyoxylase-like metal-dependent hydrolase (beta-lactamase superfamily II)/rhodanese-related sulfurtransferase
MLERHEPVTVLDIRPAVERAEWSIPGSIHRDAYRALRTGDPNALADVVLPANQPVVAVCAVGNTSQIAVAQLRQRGVDAFSLVGGMKAWSLAWNEAEITVSGATLIQFRRTGKGCLSYLVASGSEAVVVDASIDPDVYIEAARSRGWTIRYVIDTHVHADHLSRSRALAERAGVPLLLPDQRRVSFPFEPLSDGAEIRFGSSTLRALHTPGHTFESMSYLIDDRWLLTGDTLFLNAVGRPDLEANAEEARARALLLHSSLRRLFGLDSELLVLPAHTSAPVPFDHTPVAATLASVRAAVSLPQQAEEFADHVLSRIPAAPPHHHEIVSFNEAGELPSGDPTDLEAGANRCAIP